MLFLLNDDENCENNNVDSENDRKYQEIFNISSNAIVENMLIHENYNDSSNIVSTSSTKKKIKKKKFYSSVWSKC